MRTIHVIADSISMHYGPFLEKYISHTYAYSRKGLKVGNLENPEGVNGQDSEMVLAYLKRCINQKMHWDLIVLNCGLHDIRSIDGKNQVPIEIYEQNLIDIFNLARNISRHIVWVRITPVIDDLHNPLKNDYKRYNRDVQKYNLVADRITKDRGIWVIDLYTFCKQLGAKETYEDHIHFNNEARNLQGSFVAGQLMAYLDFQGE